MKSICEKLATLNTQLCSSIGVVFVILLTGTAAAAPPPHQQTVAAWRAAPANTSSSALQMAQACSQAHLAATPCTKSSCRLPSCHSGLPVQANASNLTLVLMKLLRIVLGYMQPSAQAADVIQQRLHQTCSMCGARYLVITPTAAWKPPVPGYGTCLAAHSHRTMPKLYTSALSV